MVELFLPDRAALRPMEGDEGISMASVRGELDLRSNPLPRLNLARETPKGDAGFSNCLRSNGNIPPRVYDAGLGRWRIHGG